MVSVYNLPNRGIAKTKTQLVHGYTVYVMPIYVGHIPTLWPYSIAMKPEWTIDILLGLPEWTRWRMDPLWMALVISPSKVDFCHQEMWSFWKARKMGVPPYARNGWSQCRENPNRLKWIENG